MSPEECLALRIPDLAVAILRRLPLLDASWVNPHNFAQYTVDGSDGWFSPQRIVTTQVYIPGEGARAARDALKARLRQAWAWLETQGYVAPDHSQGGNWKVLTAEGHAIATSPDVAGTLRRVQAASQLNIDLHPRLRRAGIDATFRSGDTDSAIRDAFADVEDAVRTLAGYGTQDYGVKLMSKALGKKGALGMHVDAQLQVGTQRMFEGAFAVLRNPAGHGPTGLTVEQAVETVLHADLLMRILGTVAAKMGAEL